MKRLLISLFVLGMVVLVHYYNQARYLKYGRSVSALNEQLRLNTDVNRDLVHQQNSFISKDRITRIAQQDLGMVYSTAETNMVYYVGETKSANGFMYSLLDFVTPQAQAITTR